MTVPTAMRELIHRDAHKNAQAKPHVRRIAPSRQNAFERKASSNQDARDDEICQEDHGSNYTPIPDPLKAVENAYELALSGRRQASVATLRLHTAIAGNPARLAQFRASAMEWLICWKPEAENHICAKSLSQTIVRRLIDAIDGSGKPVTELLLTKDQIAQLRVFRTEVRALMAANGPGGSNG